MMGGADTAAFSFPHAPLAGKFRNAADRRS